MIFHDMFKRFVLLCAVGIIQGSIRMGVNMDTVRNIDWPKPPLSFRMTLLSEQTRLDQNLPIDGFT